jgi:hypothetical protein
LTALAHALRYAELGWAVLPLHSLKAGACTCGRSDCPSPGKHPLTDLVPHGVHDASRDVKKIAEWFGRVPTANVGIATGEPSGIVALDVDPRNGGDDLLADLERKHGKLPDTALQLTGGGGYHYLFQYEPGTRLRSPGRGIDVKSTGGYIVADPTEGHVIAAAPTWMAAPASSAPAHSAKGFGYLDPQRIADLRGALHHLDASDYATWINVGQALHSTEAPEAYQIWYVWSETAANFDPALHHKWDTFNAGRGLHVESIFIWARDAGWDGHSPRVAQPVEAESVTLHCPVPANCTPPELLSIPGMLGEVVLYANRTAPQPQPQFAVQAALAFGGAVMGRHLRSSANNFPSLYFINVGKSSGGKEHTRRVIESCLEACNLGRLIGPPNYASGSAVMSALLHQPSHIAVVDEFGRMLATASSEGNYHRQDGLTALMSVWGQLDGTVRSAAYSTMNLTDKERAGKEGRKVVHPALTLVGLSTPKSFYSSLTEASIESGFLGRFIIAESHLPRQVPRQATDDTVPDSIVQWADAIRATGVGNLAGVDLGPDTAPLPRVVEITPAAWRLFDAYGADCVAAMGQLDEYGWAELQGRSREKAMRIALIVAGSCNPIHPRVEAEHAAWAIAYVRYYTEQMIASVRTHLHGSRFGALYQHVLERVQQAGTQGRTDREMAKFSAQYRGLDTRMRKEVLNSLKGDGLIAEVQFARPPGARGRQRVAWVATDPDADEEKKE